MDVLEAIKGRRSIRQYKDQPIPEEALSTILEAARLAPSAGNRQEYRFVVVKDEKLRKDLVPACNNQSFVGQAPVVIVGCALNPKRRYAFVDVAVAMDHMTLVAYSLGLGTCWIGAFSEDKVKELLGIPDEVSIVCLLPIGYPDKEGIMRTRKNVDELFAYNRW